MLTGASAALGAVGTMTVPGSPKAYSNILCVLCAPTGLVTSLFYYSLTSCVYLTNWAGGGGGAGGAGAGRIKPACSHGLVVFQIPCEQPHTHVSTEEEITLSTHYFYLLLP